MIVVTPSASSSVSLDRATVLSGLPGYSPAMTRPRGRRQWLRSAVVEGLVQTPGDEATGLPVMPQRCG
jgi:hypothetical protein